MNLIKYLAFIKVVEFGSITKAAKALDYSQPGISHMIDSLEKEMGFPLLIKNKDAIVPTENGKKILFYCYQIIKNENCIQETAASINGLISGSIRIGAFNSMLVDFLPNIVSNFSRVYSNIEISIFEYAFSELHTSLQNGIVDIAFIIDDVPKGYDFRPLFKDPICLIMHSDHPFTRYDKVPLQALNGCDFIMPLPGWDDLVHIIMKQKPFSPNIKFYTASDTAGIAMASKNLGVYVVSKLLTPQLPDTVVIKEFEEVLYRNLGLCTKSFKNSTPALKEFIKFSENQANKEFF